METLLFGVLQGKELSVGPYDACALFFPSVEQGKT